MKTCLSHQREETNSLQRDSLTTGVGTGDDQQVKIIAQTDGDRNGFLRIQQWMTAIFNVDLSIGIEDRPGSFHILCHHGAGKNEIKYYQDPIIFCKDLGNSSSLLTEHGQNLLDLLLFLHQKFFEIII